MTDVFGLAAELRSRGRPFVLATVVWRQGPTSGKQGAKALIEADGRVRGWLGGACAEPSVVREALRALEEGSPRLMFLGPDTPDRPGVVSVPMACESEGSMEVYLEPVLPPPRLVAIGRSPAVDALIRLAGGLGWQTVAVDDGGRADDHPDADRVVTTLDLSGLEIDPRTYLVVATQGHYDEPALEQALGTRAGYVGLVASRKRADAVLEYLRARGVADQALARVRAPAGLDLGPVQSEEIAVAVLAELVALKATGGPGAGVQVTAAPEEPVDPVCGMLVDPAASRFSAEHSGVTYYFCAAGCQRAFQTEPERYLETA